MEPKDFSAVTQKIRAAIDRSSLTSGDEHNHLDSIQKQIEAIARGDLDAALASAAADIQLDIFAPPEFKWISRASGVAELRRALETNFGALQDQAPEIVNVLTQGDTVVLMGHETGRIRATGEPYDVEFVERFTFRDGQLAAIRVLAAKRLP